MLPGIAIAHNVWAVASGREMLSEAMDRYRKGFRATEVLVWLTAAHLTRRVPSCVDPWHAVAVVLSTPRRALAVLVGVALAAVMVRCLPSPGDDLSPRH